MMRLSIRTRLGGWFGGVLVVMALSLAATSAYLHFRGMRAALDADLRRDHARVLQHIEPRPGGKVRLRGSYRYDGLGNDGTQRFLDIVGPGDRLVFRSKRSAARRSGLPKLRGSETTRIRSTSLPDGLRVRRLSRVVVRGGQRYTVHLAHSEKRLWDALNSLLLILSILLPITVLAAGLGGWALARKALRPVQDMTTLARKIRASDLTVRIPVDNPDDELGQLAAVLNEMLSRMDAAFADMKRFTSDASHELRTPLATLKTLGEVALGGQAPGGQATEDTCRETLVSMVAETNRMTEIVETLLLLSRADAGRIELQRRSVDLAALVAEAADLLNVLAEDKGLTIELDLEHPALGHPAQVDADAGLLRQAVINLLHNAIKYTPVPGQIRVSVREVARPGREVARPGREVARPGREVARPGREVAPPGRVELEVTDTGIGIDLEQHPDIFERFYRVDDDRARTSGGSGLGLSIAQWVAQAHGGDLTVTSSLDQGSTFTLSLPLPNTTK